jgi:hypothetical protein
MKKKINITYLIVAAIALIVSGCQKDGAQGEPGIDGQDATVYYSEWFTPSSWLGTSGDWYFNASAPDLTQDIVESGVILAYVWLGGDIYDGTAVRPLPAYAVDTNWSFLIHQYGSIEFTSDMVSKPGTTGNRFRFIAIPGTLPTLKSASLKGKTIQDLKSMPYLEVCKLLNIPQ